MIPKFHDVQVLAFLPAESTLLRLKKRELLDWLYLACRNWEMERDDHPGCPICGGTGMIESIDYGWLQLRDDEYRIKCENCHAATDWCSSVSAAINKWNGKEVKK